MAKILTFLHSRHHWKSLKTPQKGNQWTADKILQSSSQPQGKFPFSLQNIPYSAGLSNKSCFSFAKAWKPACSSFKKLLNKKNDLFLKELFFIFPELPVICQQALTRPTPSCDGIALLCPSLFSLLYIPQITKRSCTAFYHQGLCKFSFILHLLLSFPWIPHIPYFSGSYGDYSKE